MMHLGLNKRNKFVDKSKPILNALLKHHFQYTLRKNSEAEALFNELSSKTAQAYCSLIKGMLKVSDIYLLIKSTNDNS